MCGISGLYNYRSGQPVQHVTIERMLDSIVHRGPDDSGIYLDGSFGMGMRRLSIIDVSGGHQPMYNENRTIAIVFNGEIYNFKDLVEMLEKRGHVFTTRCDTEVIVHLYEEFGDACVDWLRGMFGFSLWDSVQRRVLIARDHLGVKPMYYTVDDDRMIYGSEIKAILQAPGVRVEPNLEGLSYYLSLRYVPAPMTSFVGIHALPPGHLLTCDENGVNIRRYWDVSYQPENGKQRSEDEYAEQLDSLLHESVRLQLMSDVPFGAFLSGGIDSSTIVALMSQYVSEPVKTFSVGFAGDGEESSELPYARMVARQYQTDHHEVLITPNDLMNLAEKIVWHLDQPIGDQATVANYMVADLASNYVKMVLTGEGGDELFAGYARYVGERFAGMFQTLPGIARDAIVGVSKRLPGMRRAKVGLFAMSQPDEIERITNWFPLFNREQKERLLSYAFRQHLNGKTTDQIIAAQLAKTDARDTLSRMLYVDTKLWLPDDLLARGDKTSMAASIEGRVPLLDHKLVEFAATVPPGLKVKGLTRKYLLKRVSAKYLPQEIINRKKQGFPLPISHWFRKEARGFVRDLLAPETIQRRGLFNRDYIEKLLDEHESGFADHNVLIWGLLNVELWYRAFIDRAPYDYAPYTREPSTVLTA